MTNIQAEYQSLDIDSDTLIRAINRDAFAQLELGKAFFHATFIENNCFHAFRWFYDSAEQGNLEAKFQLANLYALGQRTKQSHTHAYQLYTEVALKGYRKALIRIHNLYQEDRKMWCRGQINSEEDEWASDQFKKENNIRELYEYRLEKMKPLLNGAIDYYTRQFERLMTLNQDDNMVQQSMGFLYQHGYGVKKYKKIAIEFYTKAAEKGCVDAQYNLGSLYQHSTRIKCNYKKAFYWYYLAANGGNIAAQGALAYFYQKGLATEIDYDASIRWYTRAATMGHLESQLNLGKLYRKGEYVDQNLAEAEKWYRQAADQGSSVACNCLYQLYENKMFSNSANEERLPEHCTEASINRRLCSKLRMDIINISKLKQTTLFKTATYAVRADAGAMYQIGLKYYHGKDFIQEKQVGVRWMHCAAKAGSEEAELKLSQMYREGDTVEQNYYKSSIWCKAGIKHKNHRAQCNMGVLYHQGFGVRKDSLEASKWFIMSAKQENSDGNYHFGLLKYYGLGVREDRELALEYFTLSAIQRNTDALYELGNMYWKGYIIKKDETKALKMLEYTANRNNIRAQLLLGKIFGKHFHPREDLSRSIKFYIMAAALGNADAQYVMGCKYLLGYPVDQNYLEAFELFRKAADNGHKNAKKLLDITFIRGQAIQYINNILSMFILVSRKGLASMEYEIGCIYEYKKDSHNQPEKTSNSCKKALQWYSVAAKKRDPRALFKLGTIYEEGKDVERCLDTAINYYNQAIEERNSDAMYKMACLYRTTTILTKNLVMSFKLYTEAANMGNVEAKIALMFSDSRQDLINMLEQVAEKGFLAIQYRLGKMYECEDDVKAIKWLTIAAQGGITDAFYRLGLLYEDGRGTSQDYSKALSLYQSAIKRDHEDAYYRLAKLYHYGRGVNTDYVKAYVLYSKAAEMKHRLSCAILDITQEYCTDSDEIDENDAYHVSIEELKQSILMCEHVAKSGNPELQYKLGKVYEGGLVDTDYSTSFKWYSMASDSMYDKALYRLGYLYEKGLGTFQDYQKAIQMYSKAREQGSTDAIYRLGVCYQYGYGVKVDISKAIQFYIEAAKLENTASQITLGKMLEEGKLLNRDIIRALAWYTKAYLNGDDNARLSLYRMYNEKPYESFFYDRLFRILTTVETQPDTEKSDNIFYGALYYKLGKMYLYGLGTQKSHPNALKCFLAAYRKYEFVDAKKFTTIAYNKTVFPEITDYLERLEAYWIIQDDISEEQQFQLGMLYYKGVSLSDENSTETDISSLKNIVPVNYSRAYQYFKLAAYQGHKHAQEKLAYIYLQGDHGEADFFEAMSWYKSHTDSIDSAACFEIGNMYLSDTGVKQNRRIAFIYYHFAAEKGSTEANNKLRELFYPNESNVLFYKDLLDWHDFCARSMSAKDCFESGEFFHKRLINEINLLSPTSQMGVSTLYDIARISLPPYQKNITAYLDDNICYIYLREAVEKGNLYAHTRLLDIYNLQDNIKRLQHSSELWGTRERFRYGFEFSISKNDLLLKEVIDLP